MTDDRKRKASRKGAKAQREFNSKDFRKELLKIMPGYKWTVHRALGNDHRYLKATGIQTSGFNRHSTLSVVRKEYDRVEYEVKSAGFGKKACWLSLNTDGSLARALRGLQDYYERMARVYDRHASDLEFGRKARG